jgi:hypothetical protein
MCKVPVVTVLNPIRLRIDPLNSSKISKKLKHELKKNLFTSWLEGIDT